MSQLETTLSIIADNIIQLRNEVNKRFEQMETKLNDLVTKDECNSNKENCPIIQDNKKNENKAAIIAAYFTGIGGFIMGLIGIIQLLT